MFGVIGFAVYGHGGPFATVRAASPAGPAAADGAGAALVYVFRPGLTTALVARMAPSWEEASRYHDGNLQEIRFLREAPPAGMKRARAKVLVTPMATLPDDKLLRDPSGGREIVQQQLADMKATAVEKNPAIADVTLGAVRIVSFTVTDAHPKPGEFALATQGVLTVGGLPCGFTILHDDSKTRDEVMAALASWSAFGAPAVIAADLDLKAKAVQDACRRGDGLACGLANEMAGESQKPADAIKVLTAGCNAGSAFACGSLGSLYAEGEGVAKDEARAMKIFVRGCDAHGWLACMNAGVMANRGHPEGARPAPASLKYFERACGYGGDHGEVCRLSMESHATRDAYLGVQKAGCERGDGGACHRLGWAIETGYGTTADVEAARAAYTKGCSAGSLWGCFRRALFTADAKEQERLLDAACQQGSGPACYALAQPKFGRPPKARQALVRQACESSIEDACGEVLRTLGR